MATQGLLSIIDKKTKDVLFKVIVGCDGYNIKKASDLLSAQKDISISDVLSAAKEAKVGCDDCLVVMDKHGSVGVYEELHERYRKTFNDPDFNPRWEHGTADHSEILYI